MQESKKKQLPLFWNDQTNTSPNPDTNGPLHAVNFLCFFTYSHAKLSFYEFCPHYTSHSIFCSQLTMLTPLLQQLSAQPPTPLPVWPSLKHRLQTLPVNCCFYPILSNRLVQLFSCVPIIHLDANAFFMSTSKF